MFKPEVKQAVFALVQRYANTELGNKLTPYSVAGFAMELEKVFQANVVQDENPAE